MRSRSSLAILAVLAIAVLFTQQAFPQATISFAQLNGTVLDTSGRAVVKAAITLREMDTNLSHPAATNDAGFYVVPSLPPGRYELTVSYSGFAKYVQTGIVLVWIGGNVWLLFHFDPYPFILLNLAFSTQAAYAAPLILLAGNRAALRDRMTLEHTAAEADLEEQQNRRLLEDDKKILDRIEELEARILQLERSILARLDGPGRQADAPEASSPSE